MDSMRPILALSRPSRTTKASFNEGIGECQNSGNLANNLIEQFPDGRVQHQNFLENVSLCREVYCAKGAKEYQEISFLE